LLDAMLLPLLPPPLLMLIRRQCDICFRCHAAAPCYAMMPLPRYAPRRRAVTLLPCRIADAAMR